MSLDDARPLRALASEGRLEQRRGLEIVRKVVSALSELHATSKTHGNVSPDTIFVAVRPGEDLVELRDAGAKGPKDPVYTPAGLTDARTDLYATGAVLFELLSGKPPFAADDLDGLRRLHSYAPRQTLAQRAPERTFPDEVEAIVATALAQQREGRFKNAKAMLDAIDRALDVLPKPAEAAPPPMPGGPRKLSTTPGASPPVLDESLARLAKDLMPAEEARPSEPVIVENAGREVPKVPWYSRIELRLRRTPRKQLVGAGVVAGLALIAAIAMCSGSGSSKKPAKGKADAAAKGAALDLDAKCEQLGKSCGDNDKHSTKIVEDCKAAAVAQRAHGCEAKAAAAYDCYETKLCTAKKIWALDDLRVLSKRNNECVQVTTALHACSK